MFSDVYNKKLTWNEPVRLYMSEQSKNTVVPRTVRTHAGSYFKLHWYSDASNVGLCAAIYVVEYIVCFTTSAHCKIKNCTKRAKYTKAEIGSCFYAGKVLIKHTCVIGELSDQFMPILGRQHNRIIMAAYQGFMDRVCQE